MRRRSLILGLLAVGATGGVRAEQGRKVHRIAIVNPALPGALWTKKSDNHLVKALFGKLNRLGYVEGENLLIERYSGEARAARYPDMAREVVRQNPDLIFVATSESTLDLKAATTTIPIVGIFGSPVETGIVASLARPGGNITGVAVNIGLDQWGKRIQLLRQLVPHLTKVAVLETRPYQEAWADIRSDLGRRWGVPYADPMPLDYPINEAGYRRVFASVAQAGAEGMVVTDEQDNIANAEVVVALAEKNRLPLVYPFEWFVQVGGLVSYGVDEAEVGHNAAVMVGQILKGAKPADIPIAQPTKFNLAINLKTAKALGLIVPPELLATADIVIE
jgi:putative ABC transport system substrate-binding protein